MTTGTAIGGSARQTGRRRWSVKRVALWAVCLFIGAAVAGELGARYIIGLGDPPLFLLDPDMEYVLAPNQHCRRFGHEFDVNRWSMRSGDFPERKPAGELRILVIGDSIVNGGGRIDQTELATARLQARLAQKTKAPVVVANISAPSWGPPNELAYIKKYGLFDADIVLIVLNSNDYDDVPGLEYIGSAWPRTKPVLALQELIGVYGRRALARVFKFAAEPPPAPRSATHEQDIEQCRRAFVDLVALVRATGAKVALVQYLKESELRGQPEPGYAVIQSWAKAAGVDTFSTAGAFTTELTAGRDPFIAGDHVHPSAHGHELLAEILESATAKLPTK